MSNTIGAIILAAGKGKRMKSKDVNKVVLTVAGKPLIQHIIDRLHEVHLKTIVVVVGFAKKSVMDILGKSVIYAIQQTRLGTAHATIKGLEKMPKDIDHVYLVYGDEFSYPKEKTQELIDKHFASGSALTFLTVTVDNPFGLGRIVRDANGQLLKIVEEKDATEEEKKITEVNPGSYVCTRKFLETYLPKIKKSPITNEYYLTSIVDLAIEHGENVETVQAGSMVWRGVNTPMELEEARKTVSAIYH